MTLKELKKKINAAMYKYHEGQAKAFGVLTYASLSLIFEKCPEKQDQIMTNACKVFQTMLIEAQYQLYTDIALALFQYNSAS